MNKNDRFFKVSQCDRCDTILKVKTMSWFTEEVLCTNCEDLESDLRNTLPDYGFEYEGCGYIPPKIMK